MNKRQLEVQKALLADEEKIIRQLKLVYGQASKDCEKKIRELSMRTDMENLQSIIYQKQYQEALKKQIDGVLDDLNSKSFTTIAEYLTQSYENGFLGTLYDLQGQGIPLIFPMDQEEIVQAIQVDSKLSDGLYKKLSEDTNYLKKSIRAELSRGISNGSSWNQIAAHIANGMNSPFRKAYNNSIRIARTEGHRVQQASTLHCQQRAKSKGADVVKQWDSTLDNATRPHHRALDGQIREVEEMFEVDGLKAMHPGAFGKASEDCNCRCCLLQRARWALDEDELNELKERAAYFGLDKTKDFEDFKQKYLKAQETECILESTQKANYAENERINKNKKYSVDTKVINGRLYADKFNSIADNSSIRREMLKNAKEMLKHRSGQNGEDLYLYNRKLKKWYKSTTGKEAGTPEYTQEILNGIRKAKQGELLSFHNHPASMPPSAADINSALKNGYAKGYALCHDGKIFEYTAAKTYIDESIYNLRIADFQEKGYNEFDSQIKTMEYLSDLYGFTFKEVK